MPSGTSHLPAQWVWRWCWFLPCCWWLCTHRWPRPCECAAAVCGELSPNRHQIQSPEKERHTHTHTPLNVFLSSRLKFTTNSQTDRISSKSGGSLITSLWTSSQQLSGVILLELLHMICYSLVQKTWIQPGVYGAGIPRTLKEYLRDDTFSVFRLMCSPPRSVCIASFRPRAGLGDMVETII